MLAGQKRIYATGTTRLAPRKLTGLAALSRIKRLYDCADFSTFLTAVPFRDRFRHP